MNRWRDWLRQWWANVRAQSTVTNPSQEFLDAVFGPMSHSGARVTEATAMAVSTVYACVALLERTLATLPLKLYRVSGSGPTRRREEAATHPLFEVLVYRPNMEMTPSDFRGALAASFVLHGNAFARIVRDRANRVRELWPIHPAFVMIERNRAGVLQYVISPHDDEPTRTIPFFDILHLRNVSFSGIVGTSLLTTAREVIGLASTLELNAANFFSNGSRPGMIITSEAPLTETQVKALRKQLEDEYGGSENAYRTLVLGAMKAADFSALRSSNESSQFDESRARQSVEICKLFGVPPHKVGILDHATFSNIEHQQIQFGQDTILPICKQWEEAMAGAFLTPEERRTYYLKHNLNGFMRGDSVTRAAFYSRGILDGWLTRNEVRELEDLDPIDGLEVPLRPLNMGDGTQSPAVEGASSSEPDQDAGEPGTGGQPQQRPTNRMNGHETEAIIPA
jgi:HK97 family phage portal protein